MEKKRPLKVLFILLLLVLVVYFLYNLICYSFTGNNRVKISLDNNYSIGSNINGIIEVNGADASLVTLKSSVKVSLYDSNGKKVKGTKEEKYKCEDAGEINIDYKIPDDIEPGNYTLKFKIQSKKGFDTFEKSIYIKKSFLHNLIISLDKGIYKPGDEVAFRGLLLSKSDDTPIQTDLNISIYDGNSNKVYNEDVKTSEYGITSGIFKLADEVNSGTYKIIYTVGNEEFSKVFRVNPYVTPKFGVEVTKNKESVKPNEEAVITIKGEYFFGEPVKNANIEIEIDGETNLGLTNAEGQYEFKYTPKKEGVYPIKISVTDESNYMVEDTTSIACATNAFNVEILPEYESLVKGVNNDIYVYTKNIDGTPIKTYTTISLGKISRQVITDENGIGMFTLSTKDIASLNSTTNFEIESENMNEEIVKSSIPIDVTSNTGTLIKTDKVKYNQGEDIKISLDSTNYTAKNTIYILKNSNIIQKITTDEDDITVNLEEKNGLVTIASLSSDGKTFENKKSIFIKPEKNLSVDVSTDKDEYKPGDKLKLDLELKDENGNSVDGAILVSILDEAVQNLAQNDLSVDNLMLALKDIELGEDIDLASLYAAIIDSKDENILTGLLLKQNIKMPNIDSSSNVNDNEKYSERARNTFILFCILMLAFIIIKSKNVRIAIKEILAFLCWATVYSVVFRFAIGLLGVVSYNPHGILDSLLELVFIIMILAYVFGLIFIYAKYIYKHKDIMITNLCFFGVVPLTLLVGVYSAYEIESVLVLGISLIVLVITLLLLKRYFDKNKLEPNKYITKVAISMIIIVLMILLAFMDDEPDFLIYGIILNFLVFLGYFIFEIVKAEGKADYKKEIKLVIDSKLIIGVIVGILIIIVISGVHSITNNFASNISVDEPMDDYYPTPSFSSGSDYTTFNVDTNQSFESARDTSAASASTGNLFKGFSLPDLSFSSSDSSTMDAILSQSEDITSLDNSNSNQQTEEDLSSEDDNIRNIFLESLCFIPEVITQNGKASSEINLSDNITTWEIQTIGNTKDGRIGYGSKEVKVFKDFFVDFSLPTNAVVGDKVSIPVTVYNYTDSQITVSLSVKQDSWFSLGEYSKEIAVDSAATSMIYIPIEILTAGNNKFRVEANSGSVKDVMELTMTVKPNGVKVSKVVGSGSFEDKMNLDIIYMQNTIEDTNDLKVKLYPSTMTAVVENIDNIFKMPTGCFEQTSSGLYPDIVALRYMEENEIDNPNLKEKAMEYINSGYQRLLTFEVKGVSGGFSLYGKSPAEPVLTAYGLMELKDLTTVYSVDENVLNRMRDYLFSIQNSNGSFKMNGNSSYSTSHVTGGSDEFTLNAYITWALSEAYPDDERLQKSVDYIEKKYTDVNDNYTLALVANIFANTNNKNAKKVIDTLEKNIKTEGETSYLKSNTVDYWGSRGNVQNVQATALTSLALSKTGDKSNTNKALVDYLVNKKDKYGTWGTTQATILSLKALNEYSSNSKIAEQEIKVKLNEEEQILSISKNSLDLYEVDFNNLEKENKLEINSEKGELYYEVIQDYYLTYDEFSKTDKDLNVVSSITTECLVNDTISHNIVVSNTSDSEIFNGMVEINIPQGCSVKEESLSKLETLGKIEKYEYNYGTIYLYLRNFARNNSVNLDIEYKANYPETVTGGLVRVYDYYNPDVEGYSMPTVINVH